MNSFWLADRNRSDLDDRVPPRVAAVIERLRPVRDVLVTHPIYDAVTSVADIDTFMHYHVFAVWDFMCLLKELQRKLSCVEVPWLPVGDPHLRRLVNEIVVSEETDEDGQGGFAAHFELYLDSMNQCGADRTVIDDFVERLRAGQEVRPSLKAAGAPPAAQRFCNDTFAVIESGSLAAVAAAFTFSREDVVPVMFKNIVDRLRVHELGKYDRFIYYLDRHIAVDADSHGPMAFDMIDRICGDSQARWQEAEAAARLTIESRCCLWDGALAAIARSRSTPTQLRTYDGGACPYPVTETATFFGRDADAAGRTADGRTDGEVHAKRPILA
jgi:hypothetical protein